NLCTRGDTVDERSIIALSGSTGRSTGPHLHFEAWKDGVNVTEALVGPWGSRGSTLARGHLLPNDGIRREVQADGTLRFTNLP
ncbi:MAG TPA: M23 family metallopeptidase, partial [Geobacteraceae bacterium]